MPHTFNLTYAPHLGSFVNSAGEDSIDQINYMADLGFTALEDSGFTMEGLNFNTKRFGIGMCDQTPAMLAKIGETLAKRGMTMGTFVMTPTVWPPVALLTSGKPEWRADFLAKCRRGLDAANRLNGKFVTVSVDCYDRSLPMAIQRANIIDALRMACDIFEPGGVTMLLEPLSDHYELFLRLSTETYMLCRAVNRPSCKILFDTYHLQRNEGNLTYHIDLVWDEIGYFQLGDVPGRCEPGTGELNFRNLLKHIYHKARAEQKEFIFGMEHLNALPGPEGEAALYNAYQEIDRFV